MALHEQSQGATDEWYTPPYVFAALGCVFDVDAASPGKDVVPWIPTARHIVRDSLQAMLNLKRHHQRAEAALIAVVMFSMIEKAVQR